MRVRYLDVNKKEHATNVALSHYPSFGSLLDGLHRKLPAPSDFREFVGGLLLADPDLFGAYLQEKYWKSYPPDVRHAVDFLLDTNHYFEKVRTPADADKYERALGKFEVVYCADDDALVRTFRKPYRHLLEQLAVFVPAYEDAPRKWAVYETRPVPENHAFQHFKGLIASRKERIVSDPESLEAFVTWSGLPGKFSLEWNVADFRVALLSALKWHYTIAQNVAVPGDILLVKQSGRRLAAADMESIVDTLKDVVDFNMATDGDLDDYDEPAADDKPTVYDPLRDNSKAFGEEYEEGEQHDYTDLDADFDWKFYDEMHPSPRNWPVHDHSILYGPAAINRYNVDYYMNVASVDKTATSEARVFIRNGLLYRTVDVLVRAGFYAHGGADVPRDLHYQLTNADTGKPATLTYQGTAFWSTHNGRTHLVIGNPRTQANLDEFIVADEPTAESLRLVEDAERGVKAALGPKVPRKPRNANSDTMEAYTEALNIRKSGQYRWIPDYDNPA